jgi:branched-chain amino acid transport system ATP-binding protein
MAEVLLSTNRISAGYGSICILRDIDMQVARGSIVAVIGPNGAGKTTLARSLAGFTRIFSGDITLSGEAIAAMPPQLRARNGIASVPEGRRLFPALSVEKNLELALFARWKELGAKRRAELMAEAYARFPKLKERRTQRAGSLSGGEQQMLAMARALMLEPKLLVLDEPSTGLAPLIVAQIFGSLREIVAAQSCGCLLIEQQAVTALEIADFAYVLDRGRVVASGTASQIRNDPDLHDRYLGTGANHKAGPSPS